MSGKGGIAYSVTKKGGYKLFTFDGHSPMPIMVTDVKDQGNHNTCAVYAAIGNIEGQYSRLKGKKAVPFAPEYIVKWLSNDQKINSGLDIQKVYQKIINKGVVELGHPDDSNVKYVIDCKHISPSGDEDEIKEALMKYGPLVANIYMTPETFKDFAKYTVGDERIWEPQPGDLNTNRDDKLGHSVLIVGKGRRGNKLFWRVKNSYGDQWGDQGYCYIARGCGAFHINERVSTAILEGLRYD